MATLLHKNKSWQEKCDRIKTSEEKCDRIKTSEEKCDRIKTSERMIHQNLSWLQLQFSTNKKMLLLPWIN